MQFRYYRMRKVLQELDRIYFQPLFHKKCRFLMKSNRPPPIRLRKRRPCKKPEQPSLKGKSSCRQNTKSNNKAFGEEIQIQIPTQTLSQSKITIQYVNEIPLSKTQSSSSINTVKVKIPEELSRKKRRKGGQELVEPKQARLKVSRKLRLWLKKRQIIIIRRKMVNRRLKFQKLVTKFSTRLLRWR